MTRTYSENMRPHYRMPQYFGYAMLAQRDAKNLATLRRNFVNIWRLAVALLDIGLFEAIDRGQRVALRIAGESPGTD